MDKKSIFSQFFDWLFDDSEQEQVKKELEAKIEEKSKSDVENTSKKEETAENNKNADNTKEKAESVKKQSADATSDTTKEVNPMDLKKIEELNKEIADLKAMLEKSKADQRTAKINSIANCLDYDILTSLLDGVEDKDIDSKVAEIKKDKGYLFKSVETNGFNPATPQNTLSGVEAKFYERNTDLTPQG